MQQETSPSQQHTEDNTSEPQPTRLQPHYKTSVAELHDKRYRTAEEGIKQRSSREGNGATERRIRPSSCTEDFSQKNEIKMNRKTIVTVLTFFPAHFFPCSSMGKTLDPPFNEEEGVQREGNHLHRPGSASRWRNHRRTARTREPHYSTGAT